jgi:hypothetical protein
MPCKPQMQKGKKKDGTEKNHRQPTHYAVKKNGKKEKFLIII